MTEKYRLQFRLLDGFIPPEMAIDVSEMAMFSVCHNLFTIAKAKGWRGEVLVVQLNEHSEPERVRNHQD